MTDHPVMSVQGGRHGGGRLESAGSPARWAMVAMVSVVMVACGDPATDPAAAPPAISNESGPAATGSISGEAWLLPSDQPDGLRLVAATSGIEPSCGLADDCDVTAPTARLSFDTDDAAARRSLLVVQTYPAADLRTATLAGADERAAGERAVQVVEQGEGSSAFVDAGWVEPDGPVVSVRAVGLDWDEVAAIIADLELSGPDAWADLVVLPTLGHCVDAGSRLAPTLLEPGWQRFVLTAQPTGTCGVYPFLMMSLVQPGVLVTIVTSPASEATAQPGAPIVIGESTGTIQVSTGPDGSPATSISIVIGSVAVDAHGAVDRPVIEAIVASMELLDEAAWNELVESVEVPPPNPSYDIPATVDVPTP